MLRITSECQIRGASWGPGLWAWVERCSQGGNRFSRKGQACELPAVHHIQPPELRAFILGNNVGFIICKNGGGKTGLSCSESCTGRDHLSALIESQGCSAGGIVQPTGLDKHTYIQYIHRWIWEAFQCAVWKEGAPGERKMWGFCFWNQVRDETVCLLTHRSYFCCKHWVGSQVEITFSALFVNLFFCFILLLLFFDFAWSLKKPDSRSLCLWTTKAPLTHTVVAALS